MTSIKKARQSNKDLNGCIGYSTLCRRLGIRRAKLGICRSSCWAKFQRQLRAYHDMDLPASSRHHVPVWDAEREAAVAAKQEREAKLRRANGVPARAK